MLALEPAQLLGWDPLRHPPASECQLGRGHQGLQLGLVFLQGPPGEWEEEECRGQGHCRWARSSCQARASLSQGTKPFLDTPGKWRELRGGTDQVQSGDTRPWLKFRLCPLLAIQLGSLLNCSVPLFPHLQNGDGDNSMYCTGILI